MDNLVFLSEIADNSLSIEKVKLHWVISDEVFVNKDDVVMEIITNLGSRYSVVAHMSGVFIRFWNQDITIEKTERKEKEFKIADMSKVCIGGVFKSYDDFINSFYKYKAKVGVDSFTNKKTISWVYVAERIFIFPYTTYKRYNSFSSLKLLKKNLNRKDAIMRTNVNLSDYYSKDIRFCFVFSEDHSYIEFSFPQDKIKLKKNDTISFLYENRNISDFKLMNNPYKKSEKSNLRFFKCLLYEEDIENLTNSLILKWKVSFADNQKPSISENTINKSTSNHLALIGDLVTVFSVSPKEKAYFKWEKITPYMIKNFAIYYTKILKKEFPDYEHPSKGDRREGPDNGVLTFDWCYVYLMRDHTNNYYKIGISKTPEYRERTLQSEKPSIEMICNKKLPSRKIAEAFEKALHIAYADKRIRGEWFNLDDNDLAQLIESLK